MRAEIGTGLIRTDASGESAQREVSFVVMDAGFTFVRVRQDALPIYREVASITPCTDAMWRQAKTLSESKLYTAKELPFSILCTAEQRGLWVDSRDLVNLGKLRTVSLLGQNSNS